MVGPEDFFYISWEVFKNERKVFGILSLDDDLFEADNVRVFKLSQ